LVLILRVGDRLLQQVNDMTARCLMATKVILMINQSTGSHDSMDCLVSYGLLTDLNELALWPGLGR